jgi:hypothetical protein
MQVNKKKKKLETFSLKIIPFHCSNNAPGKGILCFDLRGAIEGIPRPSLG